MESNFERDYSVPQRFLLHSSYLVFGELRFCLGLLLILANYISKNISKESLITAVYDKNII